jgi:hypothetical protein
MIMLGRVRAFMVVVLSFACGGTAAATRRSSPGGGAIGMTQARPISESAEALPEIDDR